jgi:hypothetical protein
MLSLPQPDAGAATIFIDQFYTGHFERALQCIDRSLLQIFAALESCNSINRYLGCCGELANSHAERRPSHFTLNGAQNHNRVTISVDITSLGIIITRYLFRNRTGGELGDEERRENLN